MRKFLSIVACLKHSTNYHLEAWCNLTQGKTALSAWRIGDFGCRAISEDIEWVCGARRSKGIAGNSGSSSDRDSRGKYRFIGDGFLCNCHCFFFFGWFNGGLLVGGSFFLIFGSDRGVGSGRLVFGFSSLAHVLQLSFSVTSQSDLAGSSWAVQDTAGKASKRKCKTMSFGSTETSSIRRTKRHCIHLGLTKLGVGQNNSGFHSSCFVYFLNQRNSEGQEQLLFVSLDDGNCAYWSRWQGIGIKFFESNKPHL